MSNNKKEFTHKETDSRHNRRESSLRTMLLLLGAYLLIGILVLLLISPRVIEIFDNYITDRMRPDDIILFFLVAFIFVAGILGLFFVYLNKYREIKAELPDDMKNVASTTHGNYSSERRYLEQQIEKLTFRLMDTEAKWEKINHLVLAANGKNFDSKSKMSSESFLKGLGINVETVSIEERMIFVLTPSDFEYLEDYYAVQRACHDSHLQTVRGDDKDLRYGNKNMLTYIVENILKARVVIANISNRNPNVFYELGIAHMAGKPTILLCRKGSEIPFDLQQKYVIFYSSTDELIGKLKDELISIFAVDGK